MHGATNAVMRTSIVALPRSVLLNLIIRFLIADIHYMKV